MSGALASLPVSGPAAAGGGRRSGARVLPGFNITLGFTVFYLCLIVLIPLSALIFKTFTLTWEQFWAAISAPRVLASYRLTFGASMGIKFDTYLVDEVTAVGDAAFKRKSRDIFTDRMRHSSAILVNHSMRQLRQFCNAGLVLDNGRLRYFSDLDEAIAEHHRLMAV